MPSVGGELNRVHDVTATQDQPQLLFHQTCLNSKVSADVMMTMMMIIIIIIISTV